MRASSRKLNHKTLAVLSFTVGTEVSELLQILTTLGILMVENRPQVNLLGLDLDKTDFPSVGLHRCRYCWGGHPAASGWLGKC